MASYIGDLSQIYTSQAATTATKSTSSKNNTSLDMTDFLTLMVAEFQNQSIDSTADTADMLNQLVQMSVVQAISEITDATVMTYASSLVGKEVTVGQYNSKGQLEEIVGTVTGSAVSDGEHVIFVDGVSYSLSDILAVGRLPELITGGTDSSTGSIGGTGSTGSIGETGSTGNIGGAGNTNATDSVLDDLPDQIEKIEDTEESADERIDESVDESTEVGDETNHQEAAGSYNTVEDTTIDLYAEFIKSQIIAVASAAQGDWT